MCITLPDIVAVVRDILVGLAAATTALVAVVGLRKWRQELQGKAHFEVARNLIRAAYHLRDEIRVCRHPFYDMREFPEGYKGGLGGHSVEEETHAWVHIYKNRFAHVSTACRQFDSHTLEAEALWGSTIRTKADALRDCVHKLNVAIDAIIQDKASGGLDFQSAPDFGKKMRSIVEASSCDDKDHLNQKIAQAINAIEEELRPYLRRK